jgi:hypothetical protein
LPLPRDTIRASRYESVAQYRESRRSEIADFYASPLGHYYNQPQDVLLNDLRRLARATAAAR